MTREQAIKELKEYEDGLDLEYATSFDKAILYAIKALEQESILDKIRADVEQLPITDTAVRLVTEILDKYKA